MSDRLTTVSHLQEALRREEEDDAKDLAAVKQEMTEAIEEVDQEHDAHAASTSNPHAVTKAQVGLGNVENVKQYSATNPPPYPVTSVNSKTGAVTLKASDVGADASGTASSAVSTHNTSTAAHGDIRELITGLTNRLNALADSDDTTLDQMSEIVAYIKANKDLIDSITTDKVNVTDIINNLTTNVTNKPLSAAQGVALKELIDTLQGVVDDKAASADLTSHTSNKSNPHGVTKAQVGLGNVENKSSATIRGELTKENVTDALGYTPPESDTVYTHPTTAGNKHIPSGGSSGQILRWGSAGTAVWGADNNTTYSAMAGATSSAAGTSGLVPAPAAGKQGQYLRGDGTWQTPNNTTYSEASTTAAGLMSASDKSKLDGIASGANAYTHPTTAGNKHIPAGGSSGQILRWSEAGTAEWGADKDTVYTHPTYTARTGVPTANQTPAFGGTFSVSQPVSDGTGHITALTSRTVTIPNTAATTEAAGLMSASDKGKLDGIAAGANKYTHPSYTAKTSGLYKVTVDATGHVSAATAVAKSDITALGIPAQDTVYTHPSYTAKSAGLYKITVDATGHVSAATAVAKSDITGLGIPAQDTVYTHPTYTARTGKPTANQTPAFGGTATVSQITSDGTGHVTTATDRTITIPSTLSNGTGTAGLIKTSSTVTSSSGYTACPVISGVPYYKDTIPATGTDTAKGLTKLYTTTGTGTDGTMTQAAITTELSGKAPAYTYGTEDLEAGVSALETGKMYFVYE